MTMADSNTPTPEETLRKMQESFNEFHRAILELKRQQHDVISQIRKRIDQKKIQDIHSLLSETTNKPNEQ
jgi:hypothetical protein